jgi:hypothetical protein
VNPCTACSRSHKEATGLTFSRQQYVSTKEKIKDVQAREQILQQQLNVEKTMKRKPSQKMSGLNTVMQACKNMNDFTNSEV